MYNEKLKSNRFYIIQALVWALFMFLIIEIVWPLLSNEEIKIKLIAIPVWIFSGFGFSFTTKLIAKRENKKSN